MFRQVLILPLDQGWVRIVYDFGQGVQHFRLCTVTYGTAPAPYQSLRVLRQLVEDWAHHFPTLRKEIAELFLQLSYVDDFFSGAETIAQIIAHSRSTDQNFVTRENDIR